MADINLSILIVSYNTVQTTENCLQSIISADWRDTYEIIVVDNNSTDGSQEMIRTKFPNVKLIENDENRLFAPANNQASKIAKGKYLLLLNSDTLIGDDNVQRMTEYFDTLPPNVICIGPKVLNSDGSLQGTCFPNPGLWERFVITSRIFKFIPSSLKKFVICGLPGEFTHTCGWVPGCSMMVRRDLFLKVGGLNENMEFYGEEPEFGHRTSKMGYKTIYWNDAEIIHLGGVSTKKTTKNNSNSNFSDETRLRRYSLLQRETVGYAKSIWMSRIVLSFAYLKRLISKNKDYFNNAIIWEKKVIEYLKRKKNEPKTLTDRY